MKITVTIPGPVARTFRSKAPAPRRPRFVTRLLKNELAAGPSTLEEACRTANRDKSLPREIDEWQSFDGGMDE